MIRKTNALKLTKCERDRRDRLYQPESAKLDELYDVNLFYPVSQFTWKDDL
jgi:hypothetical protein